MAGRLGGQPPTGSTKPTSPKTPDTGWFPGRCSGQFLSSLSFVDELQDFLACVSVVLPSLTVPPLGGASGE